MVQCFIYQLIDQLDRSQIIHQISAYLHKFLYHWRSQVLHIRKLLLNFSQEVDNEHDYFNGVGYTTEDAFYGSWEFVEVFDVDEEFIELQKFFQLFNYVSSFKISQ